MDKPTTVNRQPGLLTKRRTIGQIIICRGCCCGQVDRGKPAVPVDWLKSEWKSRRLHALVHLTISGCLGPCDLVNVVVWHDAVRSIWLGGLNSLEHYQLLLDWAVSTAEAGHPMALPKELASFTFERFQKSSGQLDR
jgi:cobaltochelatase CobN